MLINPASLGLAGWRNARPSPPHERPRSQMSGCAVRLHRPGDLR
jgi:hypothetical protein